MLKVMEKKNNDKSELIDRTAWFTRLVKIRTGCSHFVCREAITRLSHLKFLSN